MTERIEERVCVSAQLYDGWIYTMRDGLYVSTGGEQYGHHNGLRLFHPRGMVVDCGDGAVIPLDAVAEDIEDIYLAVPWEWV